MWVSIILVTCAILGVVPSLLRREDVSAFFSVLASKIRDGWEWIKGGARLPWILTIITLVTLIVVLFLPNLEKLLHPPPSSCGPATIINGDSLTLAPSGTCIGTSSGSFIFDTNRNDNPQKQLAAADLRQGQMNAAMAALGQAIDKDPGDAEAQIYWENANLMIQGATHITLVIGTIFTDDYIGNARDNLQAAYMVQHEYNQRCLLPGCVKVRLLIANSGSDTNDARVAAQQILKAAQTDPTLVAVMGWPLSKYTKEAINVLANGHNIPMLSPTAPSDELSGKSLYFFRVAPLNSSQAQLAAQFAATVLGVKTVAIFYDTSDSSSSNLNDDFERSSNSNNLTIVDTETFVAGNSEQVFSSKLQRALRKKPDLIYFAGHAKDAQTLFASLPSCVQSYCPKVMGNNSLSVLGNSAGYPSRAKGRLYFTAFAFPDEWGVKPASPPFFQEYCEDFAPTISLDHCGEVYGSTRAEADVIISYDAMTMLLKASGDALQHQQHITPDGVRHALATIFTQTSPFPGVSGCIYFDQNREMPTKTILMLFVDESGHTHMMPSNYSSNLRCPT